MPSLPMKWNVHGETATVTRRCDSGRNCTLFYFKELVRTVLVCFVKNGVFGSVSLVLLLRLVSSFCFLFLFFWQWHFCVFSLCPSFGCLACLNWIELNLKRDVEREMRKFVVSWTFLTALDCSSFMLRMCFLWRRKLETFNLIGQSDLNCFFHRGAVRSQQMDFNIFRIKPHQSFISFVCSRLLPRFAVLPRDNCTDNAPQRTQIWHSCFHVNVNIWLAVVDMRKSSVRVICEKHHDCVHFLEFSSRLFWKNKKKRRFVKRPFEFTGWPLPEKSTLDKNFVLFQDCHGKCVCLIETFLFVFEIRCNLRSTWFGERLLPNEMGLFFSFEFSWWREAHFWNAKLHVEFELHKWNLLPAHFASHCNEPHVSILFSNSKTSRN